MKIYTPPRYYTGEEVSLKEDVRMKSQINLLVIIHLLLFALYITSEWSGIFSKMWQGNTVNESIEYFLAASSNFDILRSNWWISVFTYQFVHFDFGEFLLSISMLWLFGHILQNKIKKIRVVLLYFGFSTLSVVVFYLSHLIFPIFSDPKGIMEGAFGGVLGIMSTTVFLFGNYRIRIKNWVFIELWKIFLVAVILSFIFVFKNNMAYVLVYASSISAGKLYSDLISKRTISKAAAKTTLH